MTQDIYAEITARIIAQVEAGILPWTQPWKRTGEAVSGFPVNARTGRAYSGVNILLLWMAQFERGYRSSSWVTFKQALDMGGNVRKGERASMAVFADRFVPAAEKARALESGEDARSVPFLKRFTVFNVDQCDGIGEITGEAPDVSMIRPNAAALIAATGADIRIGGDKACYVPSQDFIALPPPSSYFEPVNWHRTAFHELGHWTGAKHRLARDMSSGVGSHGYAREELVAEMCGAFVCAAMGITPTVRHADYIGAWLAVLKEDSRAIVRAASAASKAADFVLAFRAAETPVRLAA